MFVPALMSEMRAVMLRRNRRRVLGVVALLAAILHGGVWPLLAVAADGGGTGGGQFLEICTSDGIKRMLVATEAGGVPTDVPVPVDHSECATCVCTSGGCAGASCLVASGIVHYETGPDTFPLAAQGGHRAAPYAFSPSRDPPEI